MSIHSLPKLDLDTSVDFLRALREKGPWNLTSIMPDGTTSSATFTDLDAARAWLKKHASQANIYFRPNPASVPTGYGGSVNKQDIDLIEFVYVDIDVDKMDDGRSLNQRKATVLEELTVLEDLSFVVDSGGGLQGLWRLEEPLAPTPENIEWAEGANRGLVHEYHGDSAAIDIGRLLRLPGTLNLPDARKRQRGRVVAPAKLLEQTDQRFGRRAFKVVERTAQRRLSDKDIDISVIVEVHDLDALVAEYGLDERTRAIIAEGRARGETKEPDDSRDKWMFDGICQMVRAGVPVGVIAGVLLNSDWKISGHVLDHKGRPAEVYAMRQVMRAAEAIRAERQEELKAFENDPVEQDDDKPERPGEKRIGRLTLVRGTDITMKPLDPLWPGRIYRGKLTTIAGVPDMGKSVLTCDIGARVSRGADWPDGSGQAPLGSVVYLAAEDDMADTIGPRLVAAGADMRKVAILKSMVLSPDKGKRPRMFSLADDLQSLEGVVREFPDLRILFVDPVNSFMGTSKEHDSFRDSDVRAVLGPLKEWAEKHNIAVVIVTHFKKGGTGRAIDRVMGSLAFTALSRSSWAFIEERDEDGADTGRRLLARIKQNITAPVDALACEFEGVSLGNGIEAPRLAWRGTVKGRADDLSGERATKHSKLDVAKEFLLGCLADGPMTAADINQARMQAGISEKTLNRAKAAFGAESYQDGEGDDRKWYWRLPESFLEEGG